MTQQNETETELRTAIEMAQDVLQTITALIETGRDIPAEVMEALIGVAQKHLHATDVIEF